MATWCCGPKGVHFLLLEKFSVCTRASWLVVPELGVKLTTCESYCGIAGAICTLFAKFICAELPPPQMLPLPPRLPSCVTTSSSEVEFKNALVCIMRELDFGDGNFPSLVVCIRLLYFLLCKMCTLLTYNFIYSIQHAR